MNHLKRMKVRQSTQHLRDGFVLLRLRRPLQGAEEVVPWDEILRVSTARASPLLDLNGALWQPIVDRSNVRMLKATEELKLLAQLVRRVRRALFEGHEDIATAGVSDREDAPLPSSPEEAL